MPLVLRRLAALVCLPLIGCATPPADDAGALAASEWAQASQVAAASPDARWVHQTFGNRKATQYLPARRQGRAAMHAVSDSGNSTLRLRLTPTGPAGGTVTFSWWADRLNPDADLSQRDSSDAVARVILAFDGDRTRLGRRDHMVSDLAQLVTGEPMPYATLMYVWDTRAPVGTVLHNAHTARIRKLVVESGPARLGRWLDYERDIAADFRKVFGEAPGPLIGIGVMTDANNTEGHAEAWYGPLELRSALSASRKP